MEAKNVREWTYLMSGRIWPMVRKCLRINAIPLLITRKAPYETRVSLNKLGVGIFQMHFQVFAPEVAHLLADIQHTDKLGFKDAVAMPRTAYKPLADFLTYNLPANLPGLRVRWYQAHAVLHEFANTRDLGNSDMSDEDRFDHFEDLLVALVALP